VLELAKSAATTRKAEADLAAITRSAQAGRSAISDRLDEYEFELMALRADQQDLRKRLEDAQFEAAEAEEDHASASAEVRRLQGLLVTAGETEQIWTPIEKPAPRPRDCAEVADMLSDWGRVRFTGDADHLRELDQYDAAGAWASKIWDILGTLDDYARVIVEQEFDGNVHHYLTSTPTGCRAFSSTKHAGDESSTVRTSTRLSKLRTFPVPSEVHQDNQIFMGAHFKITQFATISPRLYYCNDTRGTGRIYVGYIGKHLKNTQTN